MARRNRPDDPAARQSCALFFAFDQLTSAKLLRLGVGAFERLLADEGVEAVPGQTGWYRYDVPSARRLVADLRHARPKSERRIHYASARYFLDRRTNSAIGAQIPLLEAACVHHIWALYHIDLDYRRFADVLALSAQLRSAVPELAQPLTDYLILIDADIARRNDEVDSCLATIERLLDRGDLGPTVHGAALVIGGLARLNQGSYQDAEDQLMAAVDYAQQHDLPAVQGRAELNLSWIQNELERFDRAMVLCYSSLDHYRQASDLYGEASALYGAGNNALYLGRFTEGEELLERAARIYRAAGMAGSLAMVDWARGLQHQLVGNNLESGSAYEAALAVARSRPYKNATVAIDTRIQLGLLAETMGRLDDAHHEYTSGIGKHDADSLGMRPALLRYRRARVNLRRGLPGPAYDDLERSAATLDTLRANTTREALKLGILGTAQQVYEALVLEALRAGDVDAAFSYVERARARAFLDLLAAKADPLRKPFERPPVDRATFQAGLPPETLVLEYYTTGVLPTGEHLLSRIPETNSALRQALTNPATAWVFAVTRDDFIVQRLDLDPNWLQPVQGDPAIGRHLLNRQTMGELFGRLIAPVRSLLDVARHVVVVPHGPLHYVPFAALESPAGEYLLRNDGPALTYTPSATALVLSRRAAPPTGSGPALSLGYNNRHVGLQFSELEASMVAQVLGGTALIGDLPKRARVLGDGPAARVVHFAGHAEFVVDDPLASSLSLAHDDMLTGHDIMAFLKLDAELVTLSACKSGVSSVMSGDELFGLPRALMFAGASTVVCTLWEADDLASALVMERFYRGLRSGLPIAAALQLAQIALRELSAADLDHVATRWRAGYVPDGPKLADTVAAVVARRGQFPFADPFFWAPFLVVGWPLSRLLPGERLD